MSRLVDGALYKPSNGTVYRGPYIKTSGHTVAGDVHEVSVVPVKKSSGTTYGVIGTGIDGFPVAPALMYNNEHVFKGETAGNAIFKSGTEGKWLVGQLREPWYSTHATNAGWYVLPSFPTLASSTVNCRDLIGTDTVPVTLASDNSEFLRQDGDKSATNNAVEWYGRSGVYAGIYNPEAGSHISDKLILGTPAFRLAFNPIIGSNYPPLYGKLNGLSVLYDVFSRKIIEMRTSSGRRILGVKRGVFRQGSEGASDNLDVYPLSRYTALCLDEAAAATTCTADKVAAGTATLPFHFVEYAFSVELQGTSTAFPSEATATYRSVLANGPKSEADIDTLRPSYVNVNNDEFSLSRVYRISGLKKGTWVLGNGGSRYIGTTKLPLSRGSSTELYPVEYSNGRYKIVDEDLSLTVSPITVDSKYTRTREYVFAQNGLTDYDGDSSVLYLAVGARWR